MVRQVVLGVLSVGMVLSQVQQWVELPLQVQEKVDSVEVLVPIPIIPVEVLVVVIQVVQPLIMVQIMKEEAVDPLIMELTK